MTFVKCSNCKEDIDSLEYNLLKREKGTVSKDAGTIVWDEDFEDLSEETYSCPECSKVLFNDYESAVNFLKGK